VLLTIQRTNLGKQAKMRAWIFRVQGLPASLTDQSLLKYFQGTFTTTELVEIRVEVSIVPSYHSVLPSKNALVKFRPHPPRFLKSLIEDKTGMAEYHAHIEGNFVNIDSGFFGLTQISDRPLHETKLEYVPAMLTKDYDPNQTILTTKQHCICHWP
jgi:hypothetical protein